MKDALLQQLLGAIRALGSGGGSSSAAVAVNADNIATSSTSLAFMRYDDTTADIVKLGGHIVNFNINDDYLRILKLNDLALKSAIGWISAWAIGGKNFDHLREYYFDTEKNEYQTRIITDSFSLRGWIGEIQTISIQSTAYIFQAGSIYVLDGVFDLQVPFLNIPVIAEQTTWFPLLIGAGQGVELYQGTSEYNLLKSNTIWDTIDEDIYRVNDGINWIFTNMYRFKYMTIRFQMFIVKSVMTDDTDLYINIGMLHGSKQHFLQPVEGRNEGRTIKVPIVRTTEILSANGTQRMEDAYIYLTYKCQLTSVWSSLKELMFYAYSTDPDGHVLAQNFAVKFHNEL